MRTYIVLSNWQTFSGADGYLRFGQNHAYGEDIVLRGSNLRIDADDQESNPLPPPEEGADDQEYGRDTAEKARRQAFGYQY